MLDFGLRSPALKVILSGTPQLRGIWMLVLRSSVWLRGFRAERSMRGHCERTEIVWVLAAEVARKFRTRWNS